MKTIVAIALMAPLLVACAGGFPPSSKNGLREFDVLFGLKEVPKDADTSRIWSPVHLIYDGKPTWSVVWFKEKTKNGVPYELTAKPPSELKDAQASFVVEASPMENPIEIGQLVEAASRYVVEIKNWFNPQASN